MRRLAAVSALLLLAVLAPYARADHTQLSIMQDDDHTIYGRGDQRESTLAGMRSEGTDIVRVNVIWKYVAPRKRPNHFAATNPHAYPKANWDRYDELVRSAAKHHLAVLFDVTGPGPTWAMGRSKSPAVARAYRPDVAQWAKFVTAVGRRYSGRFRDENLGKHLLPAVRRWSIWNEPNQPGWLTPQYARSSVTGTVIPTSPILYRSLYLYGHRALAGTGHAKDAIYAGDTAPLGEGRPSATTAMRPARFIRELFCRRANGRPYAGKAAKARDCAQLKAFGTFPLTGWAHHPYPRKVAPDVPDRRPDGITTANIGVLPALLDRIARATRLFPVGRPVLVDEFGYETNPPDPRKGVSLAHQAAYLNEADKLLYDQPRVISTAQYLLADAKLNTHYGVHDKRRYSPYQSGLLFANGDGKPSAAAYALPLVLTRHGGRLAVWGQLRFRPNLITGDTVAIQFRAAGTRAWLTQRTLTAAAPVGYFTGTTPYRGTGTWRAAWTGSTAPRSALSRAIAVP